MNSTRSSTVAPRSSAVSLRSVIFSVIVVLLIVFSTLAIFRTPARFHAYVVMEAPENLSITVLFNGRERTEDCEATIASMASIMRVGCPSCPIKQAECLLALNPTQQKLLSSGPLDTPSTRVPGGVVTYSAPNMATALATCQASQRFAANSVAPITCFPVNTARLVTEPAQNVTAAQVFWNMLALIAAGLAAWFTCWLIISHERLYGRLGDSPVDSSVQNFHSVPTPRIGSLALFAGLLVGGGVLLPFQARFDTTQFGYLLLAGTPAFLGGIVEDVTKKVAIRKRLLLTMLSGSLGAWLLGAILNRVDIPGVDTALQWLPFAVAFTVFAVGGVANAMNIVDGYNGLAGGFAVIVLAALAGVAAQVGDGFILTTALILIGALLGFLAWNWPRGRIFLGDGGAYLLGFILAELSVLLVVRNPLVSPWFPVVVLGYPVFETFFSMYRRKFLRGHSPGHPDAMHMHQLIYKRIIRWNGEAGNPQYLAQRNGMVAPYVLPIFIAYAVVAKIFWQNTPMLIAVVVGGCLLYVYVYRLIVTWSVPKWVLIKNPNQGHES